MNIDELIAIPVFLLLSCGILLLLTSPFDAPSFEQGSQEAGAVIVALERYRQGWGKHPPELQQLFPDFLSEVPRPGWRYIYEYRVCEKGVGYLLYFRISSGTFCGFMSENAEWKCEYSDSSPPFRLGPLCPSHNGN